MYLFGSMLNSDVRQKERNTYIPVWVASVLFVPAAAQPEPDVLKPSGLIVVEPIEEATDTMVFSHTIYMTSTEVRIVAVTIGGKRPKTHVIEVEKIKVRYGALVRQDYFMAAPREITCSVQNGMKLVGYVDD